MLVHRRVSRGATKLSECFTELAEKTMNKQTTEKMALVLKAIELPAWYQGAMNLEVPKRFVPAEGRLV